MRADRTFVVLVVTGVSLAACGASWTDAYYPRAGQESPLVIDGMSARGHRVAVTNTAFSVVVNAVTNDGLSRINIDPSGWNGGLGSVKLGMPSDSSSPALQVGEHVSFAGRAIARSGWDFSWIGLDTTNVVSVDSGTMSVKSLTLPNDAANLVKRGAGKIAVGAICSPTTGLSIEGGTFAIGQTNVVDSAPAANPVVWLAADKLRDEDIEESGGTRYLKRWYDARGADVPSLVDGVSVFPLAVPMNTNKTVVTVRGGDGKFPSIVNNALNGQPVIDFGEPWFKASNAYAGYGWSETTSSFMALADAGGTPIEGTATTFVKEGFIVLAQNSQYDVPVVWSGASSHLIHSGYGNVRLGTPGGDSPVLSLANSAQQAAFGTWSVDAVPVSPVSEDSFKTAAFKDNTYHLLSFKTSDKGRLNPNLIASDRYVQNGNGGVRIAEVLYYYRELTDGERTQTQKYLMEKWGLGQHPSSADVALEKLEVSPGASFSYVGEGALSVAEAVVNGGISAERGTMCLTNDIMRGAALHLDATATNTLDTVTDGDTVFVRSWRDVRDNGFVAYSVTNTSEAAENSEAFYAHNVAPYINVRALPTYHTATVGGKTMPCVDFGKLYKSESVAEEGETAATMLFNRTVSFREGYIVFYDNNIYASGQRMTIWGLRNREPSDAGNNYDLTLLRGSALTLFGNTHALIAKNGKIELIALDGETASTNTVPSRQAFHQYSLRLNEATDVIRSFGRDTDNRFGGIKICEAIAFSESLSDERRLRIEQYLMEKWFGTTHPRSGEIPVENAESVSVAAGASVSFEGDLRMASGGTLAFGIGEDGVAGRLSVSGTMSFAGPQTVIVTSQAKKLGPGDYILAEAMDMCAPDIAGWTVTFSGPQADVSDLIVRNARIVMRIRECGFVFIVK